MFPSRTGRPLSDMTLTKLLRGETIAATPHGVRSSFKVWASECAKVPHEIATKSATLAAIGCWLGDPLEPAAYSADFDLRQSHYHPLS